LKCCLNSLKESQFCDELIIVDNGCSDPIRDHLRSIKDKLHCPVKIIENNSTVFSDIRNVALGETNPSTKYFHWIDGDEVLIPDQWINLRTKLLNTDAGQVYTYGTHFMITPRDYQIEGDGYASFTKDNIFRYHKALKWGKGVHEKLQNVLPTAAQSDAYYLHFGYCKQQWRTFIRWTHYAMIEFGNLGCYKGENVDGKILPYFREWRTPNTIVDDRKKISRIYDGPTPFVAKPIFDQSNRWEQFIQEIDDQSFWIEWQRRKEEVGSWKDTLDWFTEKCIQTNWRLA
jgi:glycosyltransferase involved in cell wall biosynthesis